MQIVIDIDEHIYKQIMADSQVYVLDNEVDRILIENAIYNGTPLPEHHGDLIDRSEVIKSLFDYHNGKKTIGQCIDDVQTIIKAEGSES